MREGSYSARAARLVLEAAGQQQHVETRMLDLFTTDLPMFRPGVRLESDNVQQAIEAVKWADVFVLASPDYHGSMSGAMKNFLDYHWTEFAGKLFAYLCASHEKGLTAMDQMRTAVRQCYGWSLPYGVSFNTDEDFNTAGEVTSKTVERRLNMLARDVVAYGTVIKEQFARDLASDAPDTFAARYRKRTA